MSIPRSFETVVLPHLDDAYTLARYLIRDKSDAEDVVQDAVLRALRYFDGYRDGDARAWLLAIVRNCCYTWRSKRRIEDGALEYEESEHVFSDAAGAPAPAPFHADAEATAWSDREAINRALQQLTAEYREVIVLREVQDLSYKEISAVVGVPIGTVMSRLARARKQLEVLLRPIIERAT
jgi:RNA polymerase sigma-70 factor (ECF subfamily)